MERTIHSIWNIISGIPCTYMVATKGEHVYNQNNGLYHALFYYLTGPVILEVIATANAAAFQGPNRPI